MRQVISITVLALAMMVPAWAQRGMRGGMGPIARPMPGFGRAPAGMPMAGAPRVTPVPRFASGGNFRMVAPRGPKIIRPGRFGRSFNNFGRRQTFFLNFRNCDPFRFVSCRFLFASGFRHRFFSPFFGSPFFGGYGYGYPLFWPDYEQPAPQYVQAPEPEPERIVERVIEQPEPAPQPQASAGAQPEPELPATVLVYRDQHREEIRNYAIVDSTVYVFFPDGRRKKVPLSDLDLAATQRVNDDRGVDVRVPGRKG